MPNASFFSLANPRTMSDRERSRSRSRSPARNDNGDDNVKRDENGGGGDDADGVKLYVGNLDYGEH